MEKPAVPRVQGGNPYVTPGALSHASVGSFGLAPASWPLQLRGCRQLGFCFGMCLACLPAAHVGGRLCSPAMLVACTEAEGWHACGAAV